MILETTQSEPIGQSPISSMIDEDGISWVVMDDDLWDRAEFTTVTNGIRHPKGY